MDLEESQLLLTMNDDERATRSQALRLLKKKLHQSRKGGQRIAIANPSTDEKGDRPFETSNVNQNDEPQEPDAKPTDPSPLHFQQSVTTARTSLFSDPQRKPIKKLVMKWSCQRCEHECIPIREESRCLCGHRYKEHPSSQKDPRVLNLKPSAFCAFACTATSCCCRAFFYVVAEGAWILRCRCKHKHTDHDASGRPFKCQKSSCGCDGFDSPWVCNCDHPWSDHKQETIEKEFKALDLLRDQCEVDELGNVQRTNLMHEPLCL